MKQYDGSIRINTEIELKKAQIQLSTLENRIVKTSDKIASLRSKMDALKDAKIPTQEYQEISTQIEKAEQKFNKLLEKQEQMQREGKDNGAAWQRLNDQMDEVGNEIRYAKGELQDLVETGKAFTLGNNTEEYAKLGQQLQYAQNELSVLNQKHEVLELKQTKASEGYRRLGDVAKRAFNSIGNTLKKANSYVDSFMKRIKEVAQKHLPFFRKQTEKTKKTLSVFGSRLKGLALSLLIFNQISSAFRAVTSGIKEGIKNLYNENERFKSSIDSLRASALTLKNTLASAFSPIIEIAIPYIQKLMDYMTQLINLAGQFFAAITGRKTYIKAIKQTADALEEETEAMNKQLSPLDKLNNLSSEKASPKNEETGGTMFEEVPIDSNILDMADKVKDILSKLFAPLKEAWDREGKFVLDSWKYALDEVWKLIKDIGRDFLTVWQQEETVKIFENLLHIIGDIGLIVGNLARNFREAWNENDVGLHILENIRDIIGIIVQHIRNAADATVEWSDKLDFYPLLDAFNRFLESLEPVVDSLSGVLEDFYTMVLLPLGKWVLENGLPELLQVFIDFNNKVDWESLRTNLAEFWRHLEPFAETVGEGLIIFIRRVSDALADFINSQEFKDFLVTVENWMDSVSPEDVADALEMIAEGLIGLKIVLLGYSAIKGIKGVFDTVKGFLSFFGVGGAGATVAKGIGEATTAISGFKAAIMDLAVPTAAAVAAGNVMIDKALELAEANGVAAQAVENAEEEYGGLTGPFKLVKDELNGLILGMQGLPVSIASSVGSADTLSKAMEAIANGTIYTDEQMRKMQETWGFTADDMEMLRQEMMDANPIIREMADTFGLYDATPQTLQNIAAGMAEIASQGEILPGTFEGMTEEAQEFFSQQTIDGMDYYIQKLQEINTEADNVNQGMQLVSEAIASNTDAMNEAGKNIGEGILNGMRNVNAEEVANEFYNTIQSGLAIAFDMHSPAKKMEPSGSNILLGILEGFKGEFNSFTASITQLCTLLSSNLANGLKNVKNAWTSIWSSFPSAVSGILNTISNMISKFVSNISGMLSSISNSMKSIGGNFSGFSVPKIKTTSVKGYSTNPAIAALSNAEIPAYATGQVIPRTMKQHLAILGDNTQETEVVSPLSTMKQAFVEAMAEVGMTGGNRDGSGNNVYEFSVDGQVFFRIMEKYASEYKKQHGGKPAFT